MNDWIEHPFDREDREIREAFAEKNAEIERLKDLLTRAADALEEDQFVSERRKALIAELRKVAE